VARESADRNGNTGAWAQFSADLDLGLVYVPVEMPTGDYYGGNRPGDTLFDESLVALDIKTGSASGITRSRITASGTTTRRAPRCSTTSSSTAGA
jgi:glucose dehydrogenase